MMLRHCRAYTESMSLDEVIAALYDSFRFEPGERPDWQRQAELLAPGARLVRINDDGVFELDRQSFRENLENLIDSGAMPSFWERELWRETHELGDFAHVLSVYETRRRRGGEIVNRGVKSIQLFFRDGRWWISAMLWRREGENVRIADRPGKAAAEAAAIEV